METRLLGTTRLRVTRIGLGLAALGRPGYINLGHAADLSRNYAVEAMRDHAHAVLDVGWNAGIRYVDAARSYGRAEEFLSAWLERHPDGQSVTVGSKWGYTYTAGWAVEAGVHEVKDHSLDTLDRQLVESLELLGAHLALYQIHSATLSSGVLDRTGVLDRLASLKHHDPPVAVGLTLSGPDSAAVLERARRIERDGRPLFDSVQATWNVLEPSLTGPLDDAHASGMGVIVKEALANGRLTARNTDAAFATRLTVLTQQANRLGCTVDQLALAAVLDQPWVDCGLSGAATPEQLRSNVAASRVTLDDAARSALSQLAEPVEEYWATRSRLRWN